MTDVVLEVRGLEAGYVGSPVVRDLNLEIKAGEVVALLGPNGAGKTTTLLALSGLLQRSGGTVQLGRHALPSGRPRAAAKSGMAFVPDDRALFRTLTVRENLQLAALDKAAMSGALDLFPRLKERLGVASGLLSGGEQQMLAIARALVQAPRVLMIDELSMGLAPIIVEQLLPIIRTVADETGAAVVLVEQHVHAALSVADAVIVLAHGAEALRGSASDLRADPGLVEAAYLGASHAVA